MDYDFEILIDLIRDNDKINYISNIRDLMSFLIEKSLNEYGTNTQIVVHSSSSSHNTNTEKRYDFKYVVLTITNINNLLTTFKDDFDIIGTIAVKIRRKLCKHYKNLYRSEYII